MKNVEEYVNRTDIIDDIKKGTKLDKVSDEDLNEYLHLPTKIHHIFQGLYSF